MSSTNVSDFNPILSGTATPEGMKQRLEDARQQLLLHYENVKKPTSLEDTQLKILSRLESMEDTQVDIHNVIDSVWSELVNIHDTIKLYTAFRGLTGIDAHTSKVKQQRKEEEDERKKKHFYDTATIGGVKCSNFQKGNVVLQEPTITRCECMIRDPSNQEQYATRIIYTQEMEDIIEGKLVKNKRYFEEEAFNKHIKEGNVSPLGICIIPDNFINNKEIFNSQYLDLFKNQYPQLCPSEGWYSGTWKIKTNSRSKIALYYHLPNLCSSRDEHNKDVKN